jgi:hypothetical protein
MALQNRVVQHCLRGLLIAALAPIVMAAECSPDAPRCNLDQRGQRVCPTGQIVACLDRCVPRGADGDACDLDPCRAFAEGLSVCGTGLLCEPDPTGAHFFCRGPATGGRSILIPTLACDPSTTLAGSAAPVCGSGTFCAPFANQETNHCTLTRPNTPRLQDAAAMCVIPLREGSSCDVSWDEYLLRTENDPIPCDVCDPGLQCRPPPWAPNGHGVCQRPCTVTGSECSCASEHQCDSFVSAGAPVHECHLCLPGHGECNLQGEPCCDGRTCIDATFFPYDPVSHTTPQAPTHQSMCCRSNGAQCASNSDCCEGSTCLNGACEGCQGQIGLPPGNGGCCDPLVARADLNGVCGAPCPLTGTPCGSGGACGSTVNWTCSLHGDVCDAAAGHEGATCPEALVDQHNHTLPRRCTDEIGRRGGSIGGTLTCIGGALVCAAAAGRDYCVDATGGPCGEAGTTLIPGMPEPSGLHCATAGDTGRTVEHPFCAPNAECHTVEAGCPDACYRLSAFCELCAPTSPSRRITCWLPGEVTGGTCIGG